MFIKKIAFVLGISIIIASNLFALTLKLGVVAPEGTSFAKHMKEMKKDIKKATNGKVKLKIYFGGSQGDEPDVLRKIRVGQLHGGLFTGKTLGEINGNVRVMEIPLTYIHKREKAWEVLNKMDSKFSIGFQKNGFKNLGFFEIGLVYLVSKKEITSWASLRNIKVWAWEGDPLVNTLVDVMKLVSIPLPLPDVLTSLSTGIIDAAYSPPLAVLALQWNTKIRYLLDYPLSYSIGSLLLSDKAWKKIPEKYRKKVEEISKKYTRQITISNVVENEEALKALKSTGVKFVKISEDDIEILKKMRLEIIKRLTGNLFDKKTLDAMEAMVRN